MASFERNWNESTPGGTQDRSLADDYIRYSKVNISDRLKALIYGFISGENDGVQGCKNLAFKQQSSDPTVAADTITLYAKNVGANNELFIKDEADSVVQLTTAGKIGAGGVTLLAGKDLIGSATSDIAINTDKFTVAGATGNTVIAGTLGVTGVATVAKGSLLASSDAPTTDAMISNKKYVDDQDTADHPAYSGGQSHTDGSGLIIKMGGESVAANTTDDVTYEAAFPNAFVHAQCSYQGPATDITNPCSVNAKSGATKTTLQVTNGDDGTRVIYWMAIGY